MLMTGYGRAASRTPSSFFDRDIDNLRLLDAGSHSGIFCSAHKLENMVDVRNKHCAHPDCNKCPSFNYPGKTPGMFCGLHKQPGMVDVKHKRDRSRLSAGLASSSNSPYEGSAVQLLDHRAVHTLAIKTFR